MKPRLNPDGDTIRSLRIQRGWTQEQLAEIAGVSPRTVQRAETGVAGFETVRALAGAFQADFDQLVQRETPRVPEAQLRPDAPAADHAAACIKRTWTTLKVGVAASAAGLVLGGTLVYRFHTPVGLHISIPAVSAPTMSTRTAGVNATGYVPATKRQHPGWGQASAAVQIDTATSTPHCAPAAYKPAALNSAGAAVSTLVSTDVAPEAAASSCVHLVSVELPKPREAMPIPPGPTALGNSDTFRMARDDAPLGTNSGAGALRQAVGEAAKRTSGFLASFRASLARAL